MSTFEPDTGLVVNTLRGTVHKPDCEVVTRTNQRSGPWLAAWKGVAMKDDDKPCGYCQPDLDAARRQAMNPPATTEWIIEWRSDPATWWVPWARGTGEEATKVALGEFRAAKPNAEWRVVRVTTTTVVEDW